MDPKSTKGLFFNENHRREWRKILERSVEQIFSSSLDCFSIFYNQSISHDDGDDDDDDDDNVNDDDDDDDVNDVDDDDDDDGDDDDATQGGVGIGSGGGTSSKALGWRSKVPGFKSSW